MRAGELGPDYVFFGRLDGDSGPEIFPKAFSLAAWWSSLFEIPAVVMGGNRIDSIAAAAAAGVEFACLGTAVWTHPDGPAAAVAEANRVLAATPLEVVW
jgi:thiamine-phosphate pyrophosphorylase